MHLGVVGKLASRHVDGTQRGSGVGEHLLDGGDEDVEQELGVPGSWCRLGVELDGEVGVRRRVNTLVRSVVRVDEELLPGALEGVDVDGVSVVLGRDVASAGDEGRAGDVGSTVTVLELEGAGSCCSGEELVTETDSEDGELGEGEGGSETVDGGGEGGGVSRSVLDEQSVEGLLGRLEVVVVPGDDLDLDSSLDEAPDLVVLHPDVDAEHSEGTS